MSKVPKARAPGAPDRRVPVVISGKGEPPQPKRGPTLFDFVVMPNHVHMLVAFPDEAAMLKQCANWKRYTARQIDARVGREGEFWQEDAFDHLVRSPEQFEHYRRYIADNGRRANLPDGDYISYSRV